MATLSNLDSYTFDDILINPLYSEIQSRKDVDISTSFLGYRLDAPIIAANMESVTEVAMVRAMHKMGGLGILHRYADPFTITCWIDELSRERISPIIPSVGVKSHDVDNALAYMEAGANGITIDIAHGNSKMMLDMIKKLKKFNIPVIGGNVADYDGALRLADAGADVVKVGIGGGSICSTRLVAGVGVPQLSAIKAASKIKDIHPNVHIVSDGGICRSSDIVKALMFADSVMVGSLLAGTTEAPGEVFYPEGEKSCPHKIYRGMASSAARATIDYVTNYVPEGISTTVPCKGSMRDVIIQLVGGIRSGFSYVGARNLKEFQKVVKYQIVSGNTVVESDTHILRRNHG